MEKKTLDPLNHPRELPDVGLPVRPEEVTEKGADTWHQLPLPFGDSDHTN